jgi:chromate transporter
MVFFAKKTQKPVASHGISYVQALRIWGRVAALSFGGPAGQIAVMHRILVDEQRWIGERRFLHALSYCTLLPGPEAQQLAIYIGWLMHGVPGGIAAGTLFVLPGLLSIMLLSIVYAAFGHVAAVAALFFGLKAAVLAIVLQAVLRIGARALKTRALRAIATAAFAAIFLLGVPFPLIMLAAGLLGWAGTRAGWIGGDRSPVDASVPGDAGSRLGEGDPAHARASVATAWRAAAWWLTLWLLPVLVLRIGLGPDNIFSRIAGFFSEMAVVTFGGAYAALAYVAQQAVGHYHWLRPGEMLDGLGLAR